MILERLFFEVRVFLPQRVPSVVSEIGDNLLTLLKFLHIAGRKRITDKSYVLRQQKI